MDWLVIVLAGLFGWKQGTLGRRELTGLAIVAFGWAALAIIPAIRQVGWVDAALYWLWMFLAMTLAFGAGVVVNRVRQKRGR